MYVSVASAWEAAIEVAAGRLRIPEPFDVGAAAAGFEQLLVTFHHAHVAGGLPRHHGDPFDRMLVAQSICEDLTVVTHDRLFEPYGVPVLWV